ncbi:SDR family oxidoreductase [Gryllotalpicola protaetiae]|uniref:SDR family oxidoreductase n=1 Tax=Gryllotalpicola protaetiae TaxID=2419771 RepID=A0A387BRC3_9MICO|nr:SDR family oxidoreductase [Gryllotalpicola protaetiae]AYG05238.1 SDR family oxidoreductase [Gryllotalpicola protaetiae]
MPQRTWFITGISSGFGRTMAEQLLKAGDRVAGTVRKQGSVADLVASYGDQIWVASLDVTDTAAVRSVVDAAFTALGRIDVVMNNAGFGLFGAAEEVSDEQIEQIIATNLTGSIQVVRAALPHLRAQGGGRIVQLSTVGGQTAGAGASLYIASKWGVEGFAESLADEVAPFNIGVTIVEPGGARTGFRLRGLQLGTPLAAYDGTPAAGVRGLQNPAYQEPGDPERMAALMIASVNQEPAPRRLVLGHSAYLAIRAALTDRLADVEPQEAQAASADFPA